MLSVYFCAYKVLQRSQKSSWMSFGLFIDLYDEKGIEHTTTMDKNNYTLFEKK